MYHPPTSFKTLIFFVNKSQHNSVPVSFMKDNPSSSQFRKRLIQYCFYQTNY